MPNCDRNGLPYALVEELSGRPTGFRIERAALDGKGESYTMDGSAASAKLLGNLDTFVLGRASLHVQPNMWFHAMGDHVVTFSLLPLAEDKTLVRTTWLVHADAEEGVDYDLDNLTTVWIKTNEQDATFCERGHLGISSPAYVPGPYAPPNRRSMTSSPGTSNGSRPIGRTANRAWWTGELIHRITMRYRHST
jgi:Rieske 2Fe-2S family protein